MACAKRTRRVALSISKMVKKAGKRWMRAIRIAYHIFGLYNGTGEKLTDAKIELALDLTGRAHHKERTIETRLGKGILKNFITNK